MASFTTKYFKITNAATNVFDLQWCFTAAGGALPANSNWTDDYNCSAWNTAQYTAALTENGNTLNFSSCTIDGTGAFVSKNKTSVYDADFATAIGSNAVADCNNCVVLGRDTDAVKIPGVLTFAEKEKSTSAISPTITTKYFAFTKELVDTTDVNCGIGDDCIALPDPTNIANFLITDSNGSRYSLTYDENGVIKSSNNATYTETTYITQAQLLLLASNGKSLLTSCGAKHGVDCYYEVVSVALYLDWHTGDTAMGETADDLRVQYGVVQQIFNDLDSTGFVDQVNDEARMLIAGRDDAASFTKDVDMKVLENQAIYLISPTGDYTCGGTCTQTMKVDLTYRVHKTNTPFGYFASGTSNLCTGATSQICIYTSGGRVFMINDSGGTLSFTINGTYD